MKADFLLLILIVMAITTNHCTLGFPLVTASPSTSAVSGISDSITSPYIKNVGVLDNFSPNNLINSDDIFMEDNRNLGSIQFQRQFPYKTGNNLQSKDGAADPDSEVIRALNDVMNIKGHNLGTLPEEPDYADTVLNGLDTINKLQMLRRLEQDLRDEQDIVSKSALLVQMLEDPSIDKIPIIYVEEENPVTSTSSDNENFILSQDNNANVVKRSRYYRRYPWKRHNQNRSTYDPELRYACIPTKEDVFKLLVNLHENRKGNHSKTVNFCNRKRPAKAIFTNIRFLG